MRSGYVALIGKANAGKSTLMNVLVGEKVAIVSPKPHTTRNRILAVCNMEEGQIVFVDTPGIYKTKTELSTRMMRSTELSAKEVDIIAYVVDGHKPLQQDDIVCMQKFLQNKIPMCILYTKLDILQQQKLIEDSKLLFEAGITCPLFPISARTGKNISKLKESLLRLLPKREKIYESNILTDKSIKFMIAEIMREKILLRYQKEIPHGVAVVIHQFEQNQKGIYLINLDIICEKQNHKAILIGKQSQALKEVLSFARQDMEKLLGCKVFLTAFVKVQENWRDREHLLKEFGYALLDDRL